MGAFPLSLPSGLYGVLMYVVMHLSFIGGFRLQIVPKMQIVEIAIDERLYSLVMRGGL